MSAIVGWDIGGANVKAACFVRQSKAPEEWTTASRPFEIWRERGRLPEVLHSVLSEVSQAQPEAMAVTMTAELADVFATKREGVLYVLNRLAQAFPETPTFAFSLDGQFVPLSKALGRPLDFAASNWLATASYIAAYHPDCILIDAGSTTTDIIPIEGGRAAACGRNDLERLTAGELVYTGLLRTNLAAIVQSVPVCGRLCRVSSEYFAISADAHLILGHIQAEAYTCPPPDGRPPTLTSARQRLARLVCADREMLGDDEIDAMAEYIYRAQGRQIEQALLQVVSRRPAWRDFPILAVGAGAFLARDACRGVGMRPIQAGLPFPAQSAEVAPSLAVAHLLAAEFKKAG